MIEHYVAIDLGASSGRVILGEVEDSRRIRLRTVHAFPNEMVNVLGHLHWDVLSIYREILEGLRLCASNHTSSPAGLSVDTWGLDFSLLDKQGNLICNPFTYRDKRTRGVMEEFHAKLPAARLYQLTGLEPRPIYSLFQLYSMVREQSSLLRVADALLFMPDLFNYFLTGVKKTEFTHASGSQLYNVHTGGWDDEIFHHLGLPKSLMQEIVPTGTVLGNLVESVTGQTGMRSTPVIAGATHDTSNAAAAVPAEGEDFLYISSGTWSLVGIESPRPIITEKAFKYGIANQGAAWGAFMVLKNITGLWLLQECRREWAKTRDYSYNELVALAQNTAPVGSFIDPDHTDFLKPESMPEAIRSFCHRTGQPVPVDVGQYVRVILESLALAYCYTLEQLEDIKGKRIKQIHIVGGGAQNPLLSQFAADATGLPVYAGPVEATAAGNVLIQAMTFGKIKSHQELREVVRSSFHLNKYEPKPTPYWYKAYERFKALKQG